MYVAKLDGVLSRGRFSATKTYSKAELERLNNGNFPDKDYMKANFVDASDKKNVVDDPKKIESLKVKLIANQVVPPKNATLAELKKLLAKIPEKKKDKENLL